MFGIDDFLMGSAVTGVMGALGSAWSTNQTNQANQELSQAQNLFNAQQAGITRDYNSLEAVKARDFNANQAARSRDFSAQQMNAAMGYNSREAQIGRDYNSQMFDKTSNFNSLEAQKARDFNQMMSSTAFQRAKTDMTAAGLNPILAYRTGGAGTPAGASASVSGGGGPTASVSPSGGATASGNAASAGNAASNSPIRMESFGPAMATALEFAKVKPQLEQLNATTQVTKSEKEVRDQDVILRNQQAKNEAARFDQIKQETQLLRERTENERRSQSQIRIGGISANPEAIGQKVGGMLNSGFDYMKRNAGELTTSAKNYWNMVTGGQ